MRGRVNITTTLQDGSEGDRKYNVMMMLPSFVCVCFFGGGVGVKRMCMSSLTSHARSTPPIALAC